MTRQEAGNRFVDDAEDIGQLSTHSVFVPTGQRAGDRVEEGYLPLNIGHNDGVANAGQRDTQPFTLLM